MAERNVGVRFIDCTCQVGWRFADGPIGWNSDRLLSSGTDARVIRRVKHHGGVGNLPIAPELTHELIPVHGRHHDVGDDQRGVLTVRNPDGLSTVPRFQDPMPVVFQQRCEQLAVPGWSSTIRMVDMFDSTSGVPSSDVSGDLLHERLRLDRPENEPVCALLDA